VIVNKRGLEHRTNINKNTSAEAGFTLLEVMVALMIVAMALPALVTLVMAQVDGAAHVREKTYAMWVAENELTRFNMLNNKTYFTNFKLPEKDSGKVVMMGMQWQWQIETSKDERIPLPSIVKVDIGISNLGPADSVSFGGNDKRDPLAILTGYMSE
jgi:general secretion pathway protein I